MAALHFLKQEIAMPLFRFVLLLSLVALSGCTKNFTAPNNSDCSFFGNCRCQDWYSTCSGHG
jgi:hypothetical protein